MKHPQEAGTTAGTAQARADEARGDEPEPAAADPPPEARAEAADEHSMPSAEDPERVEEPGEDEEPQPPPLPRFARAQVLPIANQKGGVGKTTTAVSVAAALADLGCRVLLVDLDPQANATSGLGVRAQPDQLTIYDVLVRQEPIQAAIMSTGVANLWVIPSTIDLAGAEVELVSAFSRELKLRHALEAVYGDFDLILVDCPPSLGLLTVNALSAGDAAVIPIQCEYYALEGLGALRRNADLVRSQLNPDLGILGFVLTMLDARTRLSHQVVEEVRSHFGDRVFESRIPRSVRLAEAPGFGQPITAFDPSSPGGRAYRRLAVEMLERLAEENGVHVTGRPEREGEKS